MGCASSNPLVDGGKNLMDTAKDTATDMVHKGEQAMHEVGETAKEGLTSGMDHVKEAMESAMNTAENSLGTMVGKISDTFNGTGEAVKDMEQNAEDTLHANMDNLNEAISEAETLIASEAEVTAESADAALEATFEKVDAIQDQLGETVEPMVQMIEETLHIEDMEAPISTPEPSTDAIPRNNGVNTAIDAGASDVAVAATAQEQQEMALAIALPLTTLEPELTPWEAAADAILEQAVSPSVEMTDEQMEASLVHALNKDDIPKDDTNVEDTPSKLFNDAHKDIDDFIDKNYDLPGHEGLLIDRLSIISYKSEI